MIGTRYATLLALATTLAAGCAVVQPVVPGTTPPEAASGYVTGSFTRVNSGGFAFVLSHAETGAEYLIPLGEDGPWRKDVQDQVLAIKVPPGRYKVSHWVTYATLTKERSSKSAITNPYLSTPFQVDAGAVTYLGNYAVDTTYSYQKIYWSIKPRPVSSREAREAFLKSYPMFGSNAFSCRMCLDTLWPRPDALSPPPPPSSLPPSTPPKPLLKAPPAG